MRWADACPEWDATRPCGEALLKLGYGFSVIEIGDHAEVAKKKPRDRDWSAAEPKPS